MELLELGKIRRDGGTQVRAQTDWLVVDEYVNAMRDGAVFPPVVVFFDGTDHWLADGFHRIEAAERAGVTEVTADVRRGEKRDAILFACGANAAHGLRRTNQDKRNAVETLLKDSEWKKWPNTDIARHCAVTEHLVRNIRPIFDSVEDTKARTVTVTRNGTTYTQNTANIGKPARPAPEPTREPQANLLGPKRDVHDVHDVRTEQVMVFVSGEPKPYPATTILPNGHPTHYAPARIAPAPEPVKPQVVVINADAQQVGELVTEPVHLVITSPPYNVGVEYDQHNDSLTTYLPMLLNVWRGCHKVMADGARIAVVVPFGVGRNPYTPFDCQIMQTLVDAGFTLRGRIVWDKNTTGNRTSWGSYRMPSSPSIRDTTEAIIVAHKGANALEIPAGAMRKDDKGIHTEWLADGDYFMGLAQDHWVVAPESAQRVKHPAPFPVDLVTRLIHFYAFPGAHILDPFGGSGTVGVAAKQLGCQATLVELSAEYCALAQGRIANAQ